jgi:hypothetical protein
MAGARWARTSGRGCLELRARATLAASNSGFRSLRAAAADVLVGKGELGQVAVLGQVAGRDNYG